MHPISPRWHDCLTLTVAQSTHPSALCLWVTLDYCTNPPFSLLNPSRACCHCIHQNITSHCSCLPASAEGRFVLPGNLETTIEDSWAVKCAHTILHRRLLTRKWVMKLRTMWKTWRKWSRTKTLEYIGAGFSGCCRLLCLCDRGDGPRETGDSLQLSVSSHFHNHKASWSCSCANIMWATLGENMIILLCKCPGLALTGTEWPSKRETGEL